MEPDAQNLEEWFRELRATFLDVARRRVPEGEVEDLVQEALAVVHERRGGERPPAAWCLQVLRNKIGNWYKRRRVRRGVIAEGEESEGTVIEGTPLEALESRERRALVGEALAELTRDDGQCARFFDRLLEGSSPRELARSEGLEESVLYRRVYRCRQKLKAILREKGVLP